MNKAERIKQALIIRNKAYEQAEQDYQYSVSKLNLPHFRLDFSEAMFKESKHQDALIAPIREAYHASRHNAYQTYEAAVSKA